MAEDGSNQPGNSKPALQPHDNPEVTSPNLVHHTSRDDYNITSIIGKGNSATVMLAEHNSDHQLYALKVLKKGRLLENGGVKVPKTEKSILTKAREHNHPFVINLVSAFQTEDCLCFVLEYLPGGDLMYHIQQRVFGIARSRFYAAEICLALEFLHSHGIIYRNLLLDNVLLALDGHIKLVGFGVSKPGMNDPYGSTSTFCGSAEFMAPEILRDKTYGRAVDWWAFGIILFQMTYNQSPFRGEDEDEIYDVILSEEPPLFPAKVSDDAEDLIRKLLIRQPTQRLGYEKGAVEVMHHPFFQGVDWDALYKKQVVPPFVPVVTGREDLRNFDGYLTSQAPNLSPMESDLTPAMQESFKDF